ncbi:hypothetical protein [Hymenobacter aerophilus]|uniref:hypothetical protein n=1 Tax=Hymenobacter aerophilus TaxID=119644 RepID=UPI0012F95BEF|nr:hypothetical protein [Hymenobacter aerophilus]
MDFYDPRKNKTSIWKKTKNIIPFIAAIVLSILSIHINYKGITTASGREVLLYWPYFRHSIILTTITWLFTEHCALNFKTSNSESSAREYDATGDVVTFMFGFFPYVILLLYPLSEQLHLPHDSAILSTIIALSITQTLCCYGLLINKLGKSLNAKSIAIGISINLIFIFGSSYAHGYNYSNSGGRYKIDEYGE